MKTTKGMPEWMAKQLAPLGLQGLQRDCYRLHPRRGETAPSASKMGGEVLWPKDLHWPRCAEHDTDYTCAIQLLASDFSHVHLPKDCAVYQLLWCPEYDPRLHPELPIAARNIWHDSLPTSTRVSAVRRKVDDLFVVPCTLAPELFQDLPLLNGFDEQVCFLDNELDDWLLPAPGTKLGGFGAWIQNPHGYECCGKNIEPFLTIAGWEWNGLTSVWTPQEEQWLHDAPREKLDRFRAPLGTTLNKEGHLYAFCCQTCGLQWFHFDN